MALTAVSSSVGKLVDRFNSLADDKKGLYLFAGTGVAIAATAGYLLLKRSSDYKNKPSAFELTGGSISKNRVKETFDDYSASYGKEAGQGIVDRSKTVDLVDVFYSLVTDLYEWGWGQSFHFSPKLPGKDWKASEAAHEARLPALLRLGPGKKCLDCGCGVGGPMRTIAATSGANVTGITINEYQVKRATYHNEKQGLAPLTQVVMGDFLKMPFAESSFDGAYAIEATCHAPKLEDVYGEIFRVLKPGCYFASYEWVATAKFDPSNKEHVRIIDEINFGNGLPEMRTYTEAEKAGQTVGFELVLSVDLATASPVCGPWYKRLPGSAELSVHAAIVNTVSALGVAPKGLKEVHKMLVSVAHSLVAGGETGVFSPMHLLLFKKPEK